MLASSMLQDARLGEGAVGQDLDLAAGVALGLDAEILERHGQQADGDLLAGGDITSSSRGSGCGETSLASAIRRLVSPLMADTTTTSWCPCAFQRATRLATFLMRSGCRPRCRRISELSMPSSVIV
jgi:hypothetical protein